MGIRAENLKGWMGEARKVEAEEGKAAQGAEEATGGTEDEGAELEREAGTKKELTNW